MVHNPGTRRSIVPRRPTPPALPFPLRLLLPGPGFCQGALALVASGRVAPPAFVAMKCCRSFSARHPWDQQAWRRRGVGIPPFFFQVPTMCTGPKCRYQPTCTTLFFATLEIDVSFECQQRHCLLSPNFLHSSLSRARPEKLERQFPTW